MLPVLKAISYEGELEGGSTFPWKVIVSEGGGITTYAVKLYKKKAVDESFCVAKDVFSSVLATQFELETPEPALIEFPKSFIDGLSDKQKEELSKKDGRLKFGCKLIDGALPYLDTLHKNSLEKYPVDTIYAFDNFIKNGDRKVQEGKSNILMKETKAYLIDHENSLNGLLQAINIFPNDWVYWQTNHIFYSYLYKSRPDTKLRYFENFLEILKGVNFDILDTYGAQLRKIGHHNEEEYFTMKEYFTTLQQRPEKFVNLLRQKLL